MTDPAAARVFLGYRRPALLPAAEWLADRFSSQRECDLSDVFVCVPGARASRHLLAMLVDTCERRKLVLVPPRIGTPLELIDALVTTPGQARSVEATTAQRLLAWCEAVEHAEPQLLRALAPRRELAGADLRARLHIAEMLDDTRRELAGHAITLAEAADALAASPRDVPELARWRAVAALEESYLGVLESRALTDSAGIHLDAVRHGTLESRMRIVLVAAPEVPRLVRLALAVRPPLAVLVVADPGEADRFDELGTVRPGAFATTTLCHDQIRIADSPAAQARVVEGELRALPPGSSVEDVLIGVPDAEVATALRTVLESCALRVRDAAGRPVSRTAPARFLDAAASLLETRHTREFAALARHPDVFAWISAALTPREGAPSATGPDSAWLRALDAALESRPPGVLPPDWPDSGVTHDGGASTVAAALGALLGPLLSSGDSSERGSLEAGIAKLRESLVRLYGNAPVGEEGAESDISYRACAVLAGHMDELTHCCRSGRVPPVTAPEAIRLVLTLARADGIPERADPDAVELVGWLEIALDDAPTCIVTGMNEGSVPRGGSSGPLLAGGTRRELELPGPDATLSRDAYLLNILLRCHENVVVVAGRKTASGDPLLPSRLLFTCGEAELPDRVSLWASEARKDVDPGPAGAPRVVVASGFRPMPRVETPTVTSMSVTSFRAYLRSPYGFFLERVLRLHEVAEPPPELEPSGVGDLFHAAMHRFSTGSARDESDAATIRAAMLDGMDAAVRDAFGASPPGVVRVQMAQLRERIAGVAEFQALRRAAGWRILHSEWTPSQRVTIDSPRGAMPLVGKIDRIDTRETDRALAILDYKTGEKVEPPEATHRSKERWTDLQLPLYRHLAAELWRASPTPPEILLGYIAVPIRPGPAEPLMAAWTPEQLESAMDAARSVVERVQAGAFFELGEYPPDSGTFGLICGEGLILHEPHDDGGTGEGDDA